MTRQELEAAAQKKWEREQLEQQAQAKWEAEQAAQKQGPGAAEQLETGSRSYLEGMTLGLSEPIISGANAVIGNMIDAGFDSNSIKEFISKAVDTEAIKKGYQADVSRRKTLEGQLPGIALGGEIGGAILPTLLTGGASGAASAMNVGGRAAAGLGGAARGAAKAIPGVAEALEAGGALGSAARVGVGALEGATVAAGSEGLKRAVELPTGFMDAQDIETSLGDVALAGGKFGALGGAALEGIKALPKLGKSLASSFGGVRPEVIDEYLARNKEIRAAVSVPDAKAAVDDALLTVQNATQNLRGNLADETVSAVSALKDKVIKGSSEAYDILAAQDDKISIPSLKKVITQSTKELQPIPGKDPIGSAARAAVSNLRDYRTILNEYPKQITLPQAKQLLQQMDADIQYARSAGGFNSASDRALSEVRSALDSIVKKKSPEYAAKMLEVADDTRALSDLNDKFGTPEKIMAKVGRLGTGKGMIETQGLERLEQKTGAPLSSMVQQIRQADPISGMSTAQTEGFIKTIFHKSSIENKKKLELLSKLSDRDLVSLVENAGIADAFTKEFNAGSRNVNLWAIIGGGALGLAGDAALGTEGAIAGAILGSMVKSYGPRATKSLLDGVAKIKGLPTVQKVEQLIQDVPPGLKQKVMYDLQRAYAVSTAETERVPIPADQFQQTMLDIDGASNLNTVQKARAIDSMNRYGYVPANILRSVALDPGKPGPQTTPPLKRTNDRKPVQNNVKLESIEDFIKQRRKSNL